MSEPARPRRVSRLAKAGAILSAGLLAVTACGSSRSGARGSLGSSASGRGTGVASLAALLPASVRSAGVIRVASAFGSPPNQYYAPDGTTAMGISVDLGNALGRVLGVRVAFVNVEFPSILPGLLSGRYDTAITELSVTTERAKQVDFVPYQNAGAALAVLAGNPSHLASLSDACGHRVATLQASLHQQQLQEASTRLCTDAGRPAITIDAYQQTDGPYQAVVSGRSEAVYNDATDLAYEAKATGGRLVVLDKIYPDLPYGMPFTPGNQQLAKAVEAALAYLIKDGSYPALMSKWGISGQAVAAARLILTSGS